tara:strand:+ start:193 stop:528 length:336 start_codon:yes stop_codon:yes gene_type:complete
MKNLKLVVNNDQVKKEIFFNKIELKLILNLYAKMVSNGEWKDYGLSISKREISFNVYHRASDVPIYRIAKNLTSKNKIYSIKNSNNQIVRSSESLESLLNRIVWKKLKLVN